MKEQVMAALEETRKFLQADGGDIEFVDLTEDGTVKVKLSGSCGSCPFAAITLKMRVEKIIKEKVPEVKAVEAV